MPSFQFLGYITRVGIHCGVETFHTSCWFTKNGLQTGKVVINLI